MRFSVIIPTFRRPEILRRCLQALQEQHFSKDNYEVIVVDDAGSEERGDPETEGVIHEMQLAQATPQLLYFFQAHQGQGVARNLGIKHAAGEIIVFIGDDIFVTQNFLEEHDAAHLEHRGDNEAMLGFIDWHPELTVTPLMQFMVTGGAIFGKFGGHQFAYDLLEGKEKADYRFFYTSNISLKRRLLEDHRFDPWFSGYGWEDIELGYRLEKRANFQLFYSPEAIGYHYHPMNEEDFQNRMRSIGSSSRLFHEKYPELQKLPSWKKRVAFSLLGNRLSLGLLKHMHPFWYYYALSKKYYLEGLEQKMK